MKRLMYLSISMLCLIVGPLIGGQVIHAQPAPVFGYKAHYSEWDNRQCYFALLQNGDLYFRDDLMTSPPLYSGSVWSGTAPTSPIVNWSIVQTSEWWSAMIYVFLQNGSIYLVHVNLAIDQAGYGLIISPEDTGNFWGGGPVPTSPQSMGEIKNQYK